MTARRALQIDDLAALVAALRRAERTEPIFDAVETLSAAVIGHRLFTIMRFDVRCTVRAVNRGGE